MINYSEKNEIHRYVWFNANNIIPREYWTMKKIRLIKCSDQYNNTDKINLINKILELNNSNIVLKLEEIYSKIDLHDLDRAYYDDIINGKFGKIEVSRCNKCQKILASRMAQQCLWCGYDWH